MKYIKTILRLSIILIAMSGCATSEEKTSDLQRKDAVGKPVQGNATIKPSGSYEECIELLPGQVFDYEFEASDFVNFNVHYHAESGVHYPVNSKGVRFGKGTIDPVTHTFYTEDQENYCLMWDNPNDGKVEVSYRGALRKK